MAKKKFEKNSNVQYIIAEQFLICQHFKLKVLKDFLFQ